jgi:CMP-2-keto-3-deoxyoctulosonic acid synthetase
MNEQLGHSDSVDRIREISKTGATKVLADLAALQERVGFLEGVVAGQQTRLDAQTERIEQLRLMIQNIRYQLDRERPQHPGVPR